MDVRVAVIWGLFGFRYWDNGSWDLVKGEEIFSINPLDGEVFANIVNMSTGFQASYDAMMQVIGL